MRIPSEATATRTHAQTTHTHIQTHTHTRRTHARSSAAAEVAGRLPPPALGMVVSMEDTHSGSRMLQKPKVGGGVGDGRVGRVSTNRTL